MSSYAVTLAGPALDWLADCRDAKLKRRIGDVIDRLGENPRPPGCVKFAGESAAWRVRVGEYRIFYEIYDGRLACPRGPSRETQRGLSVAGRIHADGGTVRRDTPHGPRWAPVG